MERKLWGFFSATHVVAIIGFITLAIAVPTGVWAVSFTYNVLYNPTNGQVDYIDTSRRLWVYDTQQALSQTPANFVRFFSLTNPSCSDSYTVPAGKALILQSLQFYLSRSSAAYGEIEVFSGSGCGGDLIALGVSDRYEETVVENFGSGIAIPAGRSISAVAPSGNGNFHGSGYLVPAGQVPATATVLQGGSAKSRRAVLR